MTNLKCDICRKQTRPADEKPFGLDSDCGGDCFECVAHAEGYITREELIESLERVVYEFNAQSYLDFSGRGNNYIQVAVPRLVEQAKERTGFDDR